MSMASTLREHRREHRGTGVSSHLPNLLVIGFLQYKLLSKGLICTDYTILL